MISELDLYILNSDDSVAPFPSEAEQIVLYDFAFEAQRMGSAPEITANIQANGSLENSLTTKVFCEYKGERYFLKNTPSSSKDNTDPRYTFDLTFVSERTILDNVYMVDAVQGDSNIDRYQSNSTIIVFTGTIEEFVGRLNASMAYTGVGYSVVLDEGVATESKLVSFQDKFFTEALQEGVKIFNIPYYYVGKVIHFGWSQNTTPTLKYGDGLLSIDKSINSERIVNRATATGSSTNIPYYYPNPTPRGEIKVTHDPLMDLVVDNYYKASKIPEGTTLVYRDAWGKVDLFAYYPYYMGSIDNFLPPVNYDKKEFNGVIYAGNARSFFFAGIETGANNNSPIDVDVEAVFKATMDNPFNSNIEIKGLRLYRDDNGELKEVDSQIDYSYDLDLGEWGKSDTIKLTLKISVKDFPADSVRFLSVELKNNQDSNNHIPVVFSFNNYQYGHDEGWYIKSSNEHYEGPVDLGDYGIRILNDAKDGEIGIEVINKIPFATSLMPPIYRESNGERRFYNAVNGAYEGVIFENEYSKENPKEAITTFEDIKPTIVGVTNAYGERIDMFAEFAYDLNDSDETEQTDESSESFIHPYFYAKLRKTNDAEGGDKGFNLFAQAIESGEMTIEMTSGHCGACKFVIAVDENTQRNLVMVDANGNLVYDEATGKVKMASDAIGLDRQNDTQNYEVWIALKKDINTFGTVMPMANSTIKPSIDDTFVITNIILPQAYFTAAEKKLEAEIIAFLEKNNAFQFKYNVNFSRIFLKKRNDVFSLLSENAVIPIEYNGKKSSFYISSYTYRKQKNDVLPEISVSLTDNFDSTPSSFQQTINSVQTNVGKAVSNVEHKTNKFVKKEIAETRRLVAETTGEFVSVSGEETIKGRKNFVGGLSVNGVPIVYDPVKKAWEFKGDFVVTGAITMFGSLSGFQPSTVTEAVEVDGETIVKTKNSQGQWQLTAIGRGDGTGGGISATEVNLLIENALKPYALSTSIPTDNKQLSNGAGYATVSDLDTRINNLINGAPAAYDTLKEIADVLAGNINSIGDILTALDTKATKTYVDGELAKYILKDTAQDISVRHNFVDGLQIGGLPITKSASANNTIYLDANLVVSGAITMFGTGSTTFPTIWANIPFDLNTMEWTGSVWRVKGGGSGGSGSGGGLTAAEVNLLIENALKPYALATSIPTDNKQLLNGAGYATISDVSSALAGYATQSWVGDNYLSKAGGTINGSITIIEDNWANQLHLKTSSAACGIRFYIDDVTKGVLQTNRNGVLQWETDVYNTILHSGNIGSYNAGSATKLQTPRTIWGQSFDGIGDITGDITLGGRIYASGDFFIMHSETGRQLDLHPTFTLLGGGNLTNGNPTYIDGHNVYIRYAKDTAISSFLGNGNVAVGGTTADAKLHVHGTGYVTNHLSVGAYLAHANIDRAELSIVSLGDSPTDLMFGYNGTRKWSISSRSATSSEAKGFGLFNYETNSWSWVMGVDNNMTINGNAAISGILTMSDNTNPAICFGSHWYLQRIYNTIALGLGYTNSLKVNDVGDVEVVGNIEGGIFELRNSSPDNPLLRLTVGNQDYHVQATSDGIYLGSISTLSLKVDANGNTTINGNLLTTGAITTPQINIGGLAAYKLQDDTLFIDANVVVRGAISMFGVNTLAEMESIEQRLLSLEQKVQQLSA